MSGLADTRGGMARGMYGWPDGGFVRHVPASFGFRPATSTAAGAGYFIKDIGASNCKKK